MKENIQLCAVDPIVMNINFNLHKALINERCL